MGWGQQFNAATSVLPLKSMGSDSRDDSASSPPLIHEVSIAVEAFHQPIRIGQLSSESQIVKTSGLPKGHKMLIVGPPLSAAFNIYINIHIYIYI